AFEQMERPYYSTRQARPWFHGNDLMPRRALFSLGRKELYWEEAPGGLLDPEFRRLANRLPNEVFLLSADSREALLEEMNRMGERSRDFREAHSFARGLAERPPASHRLAVIAPSLEKFRALLEKARKRLEKPDCERFSLTSGVFYGGAEGQSGKVAFLFPGQGSQYPNMLLELALVFPGVQALFDRFDEECHEGFPKSSEFLFPIEGAHRGEDAHQALMDEEGAEAITLGANACHGLWQKFGLVPDLIAGYSIGEFSALIAAGIMPIQRQDVAGLMSELTRSRTPGGRSQYPSIAVSGAPQELVEKLIEDAEEPLYLALDSCPNQVVMAGHVEAVVSAEKLLREAGATVVRLRFDRGYHTPLYERKARRLGGLYDALGLQAGNLPVFSCISLDYFPQDQASIKELALSQWTNRVRFREAVDKLYDQGVRTFLEVGAGSRLTGFVRDCLRGRKAAILATDSQGRGLRQLQQSFCQLFVDGRDLDPLVFFEGREVELPPGFRPASDSKPTPLPRPEFVGAENVDPRLSILKGHMGLMQDFLELQNRVHRRVTGQAVAARPVVEEPVAPAPKLFEFSLLPDSGKRVGDSVYWEMNWTAQNLPVLVQHALGNRCAERDASLLPLGVVPFAFVAELMAQAFECCSEGLRVIELSEIRALRWLANDAGVIRVGVEVRGRGPEKDVLVSEILDTETHLAYSARVLGAREYPAAPEPMAAVQDLNTDIQHSSGLFYELAFHLHDLQGIHRLRGHSPRGVEIDMVVPRREGLIGGTAEPQFVLNPALLDCMGQSLGYWLLEELGKRDIGLYPYRIQSYKLFQEAPGPATRLLCRSRMEFNGQRTKASFDLLDRRGRLVARVETAESLFYQLSHAFFHFFFNIDYQAFLSARVPSEDGVLLRYLNSLDETLLSQSGGIFRRGLAHMCLSAAERESWKSLAEEERTPWLLKRLAVKDALRQWAEVEFLPADIDCGRDGLTPGGASFGMLKPFPNLAVAVSGTDACAACWNSDHRVGLAFVDGELEEAALEAARSAAPELRVWKVLPDSDDKDCSHLRCNGIAAKVRYHQLGRRRLAVCKCPAKGEAEL
ncbi:MAG: polyketide synthase dehydratase domain-containing protein, partial [Candidatus Eremiobacteraeota bacterium]|nr:polyketide synthase dehydratase domain-containing protein [Candidatus Eremiobacteraeota bacterium]